MAIVSLLALVLCIAVSFVKKINAGILAIPLAFIVGVYMVGMSANDVIAGFPTSLILTCWASCSFSASPPPTAPWIRSRS